MAVSAGGTNRAEQRALLSTAALVAFGVMSFYVILGLLLSLFGAVVYNYSVYLLLAVGMIFVFLGYATISDKSIPVLGKAYGDAVSHLHQKILGQQKGVKKVTYYTLGFFYGFASHTCTLPILIGIVLIPLAAGSYVLAGASVMLYGLSITLMFLVMVLLGSNVFLAIRNRAGSHLRFITGMLFIGAGVYLILYFMSNFGVFI